MTLTSRTKLLVVLSAMMVPVGCDSAGTDGQGLVVEPEPIEAGRASPPGTYGALDVVDYDVEVGLPGPGGSEIVGRATLTARTTEAGAGEAVLDFTGLSVLSVTVDGSAVDAVLDEGRLHVPLAPRGEPDRELTIAVEYRGTPDDGLILRNNVHGRPAAFVDNWPNRTRFWLPSVDHPSDKATASFTIHAPAAWRVIANGTQMGAPTEAAPAPDGSPRRTWRWRQHVPVSAYNLVFGAAEMEVKPLGLAACGAAPATLREDGCVEVTAWLFTEDTAQASSSFVRAAEMVDFYSELVGPYPFEKLAHVQSATRFGGMENASAIFYTEQGLSSGRDMEGTVAHETAHQWFGDHVTEVDWPELWLSEGFATYFGHLYFERADGVEVFRERMEGSRTSYLESEVVGEAVIDRDEQDLFALLNPNNYPKGGWVLHMLRGIMGDEAFFRGIRAYYARYGGANASTGDFRGVMEDVWGGQLGWFFEQWLERPGYPVLAVEHGWDGATDEVVVTIRQMQDATWPTFRLPMEVELVDADGSRHRHAIQLTGREQVFRFGAARSPETVIADPDGWVLTG